MDTEVFTPFVCGAFTTLFSKDAAVEALNKGKVIFFAGGTGHPYFSTDTGAVLRAIEIEADAMLLAKAIDGIYDSDPKVNPEAKKYDEISIQEIIRKLKEHGAITNKSCGIHVHIDASPFDARTLRNITNIMASKEDLIYKALQVSVAREDSYCQKVEQRFLEELNRKKPNTLDGVERIWYDGESRRGNHYDDSRYHCLNLHSVFQKGTIEFRLFNGTLHAGKIKAYIQFCLAIGAQALNQSCASRRKTQTTNEKYTFRTWLLRLGLNGDEFATARLHLLKNLPGCIAWRDPAQAEAQKERLRQKKEKERETARQEPQISADRQEMAAADVISEETGRIEESPAFTMQM